MITIPVSITTALLIAAVLLTICLSFFIGLIESIKDNADTIYFAPVTILGAMAVLYMIVGIIDPKMDTMESLKSGGYGLLSCAGLFLLQFVIFKLFSFLGKVFLRIFSFLTNIDDFLIGTVCTAIIDFLEDATVFFVCMCPSDKKGKMPAFLYPIQIIVYLPFYLLSSILWVVSKLLDWFEKYKWYIGAVLFVIYNVMAYVESDGIDFGFSFLYCIFNKERWDIYLSKSALLFPASCSTLTYILFGAFWSAVAYVLPIYIILYVFSRMTDLAKYGAYINVVSDEVSQNIKTINEWSGYLYDTQKWRLALNYAGTLVIYVVIFFVIKMFL